MQFARGEADVRRDTTTAFRLFKLAERFGSV
jgi:hypothetical protein